MGIGGDIEGRCRFCGAEYETLDAGRYHARQVGTRYGDGIKVTAELLSGPNAKKAGRNSRAGKWLYAVEVSRQQEEEKKRIESAAADNQKNVSAKKDSESAEARTTETKSTDSVVLSESAASTPTSKSESKKKTTFGWKETQTAGSRKPKRKSVTRTAVTMQNDEAEPNTVQAETDRVLSENAAQGIDSKLPDKSISNNTETKYSNHDSQEVEIHAKSISDEQVDAENLTGLDEAYNAQEVDMDLNQIFGLDDAEIDEVLSGSKANSCANTEQQGIDSNPDNMADGTDGDTRVEQPHVHNTQEGHIDSKQSSGSNSATDADGILSGSEATEESNANGTDNADGDGSVAHNSNPDVQ